MQTNLSHNCFILKSKGVDVLIFRDYIKKANEITEKMMQETIDEEINKGIGMQELKEKYKEYFEMKKIQQTTVSKTENFFGEIFYQIFYGYGFYILLAMAVGISWYFDYDEDLILLPMLILIFAFVSRPVSLYVARIIDRYKIYKKEL